MTLNDLLFLASFLFAAAQAMRIAVAALRGRWDGVRRAGWLLGAFIACYAVVLIGVSLATPRRFYAPGERRCFDDWCVAASEASATEDTAVPETCRGGAAWIATVEVSSVARRVLQRAPDARAEMEDQSGSRYQPCAEPLAREPGGAHRLTDQLGPGDSFPVFLPFRLPAGASPAGLVFHHGEIPGVGIIGEDQSFLHPPAIHRVSTEGRQGEGWMEREARGTNNAERAIDEPRAAPAAP
jgi:hypothetical protein